MEEVDLESLWGQELDRDAYKREAERRVAEGEEHSTFWAFGRGLSRRFPIPGNVQARAFRSSSQQPSQVVIAPAAGRLVWFAEDGINVDRHVREGH